MKYPRVQVYPILVSRLYVRQPGQPAPDTVSDWYIKVSVRVPPEPRHPIGVPFRRVETRIVDQRRRVIDRGKAVPDGGPHRHQHRAGHHPGRPPLEPILVSVRFHLTTASI